MLALHTRNVLEKLTRLRGRLRISVEQNLINSLKLFAYMVTKIILFQLLPNTYLYKKDLARV